MCECAEDEAKAAMFVRNRLMEREKEIFSSRGSAEVGLMLS